MGRPDTLGDWTLHGNDPTATVDKPIDRFVTRMLIVHNMVDESTFFLTWTKFALARFNSDRAWAMRPVDRSQVVRQPADRCVSLTFSKSIACTYGKRVYHD